MAVFADGKHHEILLEQIHVLSPPLDPGVLLLGRAQPRLLDLAVLGLVGGGEPLVEHRGEEVDGGPVLGPQHLVEEPGQVEVDDDIVEEGVVLQGAVVRHAHRHRVLPRVGVLAQLGSLKLSVENKHEAKHTKGLVRNVGKLLYLEGIWKHCGGSGGPPGGVGDGRHLAAVFITVSDFDDVVGLRPVTRGLLLPAPVAVVIFPLPLHGHVGI